MDIFFDSETLPTIDPKVIERISAGITHPGSMKKPDTIAAWIANERPAAIAEAVAKTALDGAFGRLAVLGFAFGDDDPIGYTAIAAGCGQYDEKRLIEDFFFAVDIEKRHDEPVRLIGHNLISFDLRFVTQRSIINGVRLPDWWPINPRPWDTNVIDTMTTWSGPRDYVSLDKLCLALGLEGKGDIDGSQVAALWAAGKYGVVRDYCCDDVRKVRAVAKRMMASLPLVA